MLLLTDEQRLTSSFCSLYWEARIRKAIVLNYVKSIDILQDSNPIENIDFSSLTVFFISWPFMLFGQRISSVVAFYLAIIFSTIPFFYFLLSIQFPIPCLHYLTHFIWNWISNTAAAATTFFFHLHFRLSFTLWIELASKQNEHTKNTVETMGITYRMEKNIAAKAKISIFLSLEGSKFIQQIATNTTNSATRPFRFSSQMAKNTWICICEMFT